jgi:hypothetical protein
MKAPAEETWEPLTTANDDIDAQLLVGLLAEADIPTRVVKNRSGYGDYLYGGSNPWAPVAVHVPATRLAEARRALEEARFESGEGAAVDPEAASAGHWLQWIAVGIVTLIVLTFLIVQRDLVL